jgi:tetratricopeptide (TPR) repeat protein
MGRGTKMTGFHHRVWIFFCLCLLFLISACLPNKKLTVGTTAILLEGVARASSRQPDLRILREGTPAYLMLIDGMIQTWPDNERLLLAGAQSYSSFASLFVEDQDKEYANLLYERAKRYAFRSLERRGLTNPGQEPFDDFMRRVGSLGKKDVPILFWAATCWANWIRLNLDSMEALSELPRVEAMMKRVLELDEGFYYGGPHLFMGIWYAVRPKIAGGDLKKAQEHFLKALDLGQRKFLMADVYYASYYARKSGDKELFIATLQKVLEAPADTVPDLVLVNTVAKRQAKELLSRVEEYFD